MISQVGPGASGSAGGRKAGPKGHSEVEVVAEDMASFLARQQAYLQGSGGGVGAPGGVPGGVPPGAVNPGSPVNQATKGGEGQRKSIGSVSPGGQNSPKKVILIILCLTKYTLQKIVSDTL